MGKIPVSDPIRPRAPHLGDLPFAIIPDARRRFTGILACGSLCAPFCL